MRVRENCSHLIYLLIYHMFFFSSTKELVKFLETADEWSNVAEIVPSFNSKYLDNYLRM